MRHSKFTEAASEWLERVRLRLSSPDALLHLSVMGLLAGLAAGLVIVFFRLLVEGAQESFLPGNGTENYEALPGWARLLLPLLGGVLLAMLFRWVAQGVYMLGVARVLDRMAYHQGHLTPRELIVQFLGAAVAIASGHSVGREGPHVHLGASAGSVLGQSLHLPNNSIRTLVGCGAAAAIAASFNTPLAGVVFALEVIMMEYTVASFLPVILAAVSANALAVAVFGSQPAFHVPALPALELTVLPEAVVLGLVVGTIAALFVHLLQQVSQRSRHIPIWWRMLLAGGLLGLMGLAVPEVMGIGYDTVNGTLLGEFGLGALVLILFAKLVATSLSVGLGVPGGMIGPSLFLGACVGSFMALLAGDWLAADSGTVALFALLGMGAMMGASLQAPLAALVAIMELTHSPGVLMPGMLTIVVASLTARELFGKKSLFLAMLEANGKFCDAHPVRQSLQRIGVAGVMARDFVRVDAQISRAQAESLINGPAEWLLIDIDGQPNQLMKLSALAVALRNQEEERILDPAMPILETDSIDLLEIAAQRLQLTEVPLQANLYQAQTMLDQPSTEALCVCGRSHKRVYGVITQEQVEAAYRH